MNYFELKQLPRKQRRKIIREIESDYDKNTMYRDCYCGSGVPFKRCCMKYNEKHDPLLEKSDGHYRQFNTTEKKFLASIGKKLGGGSFKRMVNRYVSDLNYQLFGFGYCSEEYAIENKNYSIRLNAGLSENSIEIFTIEVFNSGQGVGTEIMNILLNEADKWGVDIYLIPISYKDTPKEKLMEWYSGLGFKLIQNSCYWIYNSGVQESYKIAS